MGDERERNGEMKMQKFFDEVVAVLKKDKRFVSESGELMRNAVYEAAMKMDERLLKLLYANAATKNAFFKKVGEIAVFDKQGFGWTVSNEEILKGSYTRFRNKIGLATREGDFISAANEVELVFPYRDCILNGGQTKEDATRDEVFYNRALARDEVARLLSPKVLVNAEKYEAKGKKQVSAFDISDNLIIKGNNLLGLASLLQRYEGLIKSVFIDPPYYFLTNKPSDTFSYNSNFKLSTWLVFLQNRIRLAYQLMRKDGLLFITMSDEGVHYLKVMIDDIFRKENFIADVTWESRKSVSSDGLMSMNSNHVLVYAKNVDKIKKDDFRLALDEESFAYDDNDGRGKYKLAPLDAPEVRANGSYVIVNPNTGVAYKPPRGRHWSVLEKTYKDMLKDHRIRFGADGKAKPQVKSYYSEAIAAGKGKATSSIWHDVSNSIVWQELDPNTNATKDQMELFGKVVFTNPKPEDLLRRIIELSTDKGDIVLDFFMGSGTTQATAMKMGRRFIGLEQMDYIEDVTLKRLQFVMEGEQTGISKDVNWKGGGSFVYCELAKSNQVFVERIEKAKKDAELKKIWEEMFATGFISCKLDPSRFSPDDADYLALPLKDKKRILMDLLDLNQLYVNYCDMDDKTFKISVADKAFTKSFYEGK